MSNDFDKKNKCKSSEDSLVCELKKVDAVPFHMPGHKRQDFDHLLGASKLDYTEIEGTDNLHDARGILKDAMEHAADVFSVRATRFLVDGSTCGILAGIRAASKRGDAILVARNCHKSVYNAIELLGLVPEYIMPECIGEFGLYGSVEPSKVESLLEKTGAKLVVITSPTYEGVISDVKTIADVCHKHGAILFVDEAHGAHLGFDGFEDSARTLGADIVVNSLHKTLPSLTQTALLHVCSKRVDIKRLDESLAMFETSSPSYVLMASIDGCVRYAENGLENWAKNVDDLRAAFADLKYIKLFDKNDRVFAYDKSKLVFLLSTCNLSGIEFANILREKYGIELEMASLDYAIAMTGAGDTADMYAALKKAVKAIDSSVSVGHKKQLNIEMSILSELPKKAFNPCEMDSLSVEYANTKNIIGRVSAENIWAYPPGAPVVVKGEIVDENRLAYLNSLLDAGVSVSSSRKNFPENLAVVKR